MAHAPPTRPPAPDHILLVEDDPDTTAALQAALDGWGFRVTAVASAEETLALFPAAVSPGPDRVDLILLDLAMPDQDGVELVRELLQRGYQLPPIVIVSARSPLSLKVAADFMRAAAVIRKPFQLAHLLATVRKVLAPP